MWAKLQESSAYATKPTAGWHSLKYMAIIVGIFLAIVLLSRWTGESGKTYPRYILRRVRTLVQEAIRWGVTSTQDSNPVISLTHATYAVAYLNVARHLVTDQDIAQIVGSEPREIMHDLQQKQSAAMQRICQECPQIQPDLGRFGTHTGWIG